MREEVVQVSRGESSKGLVGSLKGLGVYLDDNGEPMKKF